MKNIAQEIRKYRIENDLLWKEVASRLGTSVVTVQLWGSGRVVPNERNLYKLKKLLGK
jgi:DNA-binding transcriptional regulator YiaG